MLARLSALVIWGLVAATAVFWGLRLWVRAPATPANAVAAADSTTARGDLTRLLGVPPAALPVAAIEPEMASRFRLLGVMAPRASVAAGPRRQGVALIAVDGQPPKAYVVGSALDGELVLQSVSLRTASIGRAQGDEALKLELPALPPPATGTLPGLGAGPMPVPVPLRGGFPPSIGLARPQAMPQPQVQPPRAQNLELEAQQRDIINGVPTE